MAENGCARPAKHRRKRGNAGSRHRIGAWLCEFSPAECPNFFMQPGYARVGGDQGEWEAIRVQASVLSRESRLRAFRPSAITL